MPRGYTSEVRAERSRQTRSAVVAAARELFVTEGWVATTIARVAEQAAVARQTVYLLFDSKLALLDACIDDALSPGRVRPVREQADYRQMGVGDFDARLAAGARWLAGAHQRSATIQRVLDEAAVSDPLAAARLQVREQARWTEVRWAMSLVLATPDPDPVLVDGVWTLASRDVWLKLVGQRGWSAEQWQSWFVQVVGGYRRFAADA